MVANERLVEEGRREAARDRRVAHLFHRPENRDAMLRRADVTEELADTVEALMDARADALRTLSEVAAGMTDDAYDALRTALSEAAL